MLWRICRLLTTLMCCLAPPRPPGPDSGPSEVHVSRARPMATCDGRPTREGVWPWPVECCAPVDGVDRRAVEAGAHRSHLSPCGAARVFEIWIMVTRICRMYTACPHIVYESSPYE